MPLADGRRRGLFAMSRPVERNRARRSGDEALLVSVGEENRQIDRARPWVLPEMIE